MFLKNENLVIRNATAADAPQLAAWWNDGSVMAHAGFPNGLGITVDEIVASLAKDTDEHRRHIIEENGTAIGEMNYRSKGNGVAEIGIKICDAAMQERGLGRIALSLLIKELFSMGFSKIVLDTNLTNTRAQHVYEKLGFQKIAIRENSWTDQLGNPQSAVDYELQPENFCNFAL